MKSLHVTEQVMPQVQVNLTRFFKYITVLALIFLEFSACNPLSESRTMRVTAIPNLRMREEPSIMSKSIAFPKYGEFVESFGDVGKEEMHDRVRGRWNKIIFKGKEGYVFGGFLKEIAGTKKTATKPILSQQFKGISITSILIWSGIGAAILICIIVLIRKRSAIISKSSSASKKRKQNDKQVSEIKRTNAIEDIVQVWSRTGEVTGHGKRSDTYVSGGGSVRDGTGSVSISSQVVVKQEFFIRQADGEEMPVQISGLDIPIRNGQRVSLIYVATRNGKTGSAGRLVNYNAKRFYITEKARRLLKLLRIRAETSIGLAIGALVLFAMGACFFAKAKTAPYLGVLSIVAFSIYIIYHIMAESLGKELDRYLDTLARDQLSKGKDK